MKILTEITNDYNQQITCTTEDNYTFTLGLRFSTSIQCWLYSITYGTWSINNQRVVTHPNFLNQFKNILPFGIACNILDGTEPYKIDDFLQDADGNARAYLCLLTKADIATIGL